MSDREEQRKKRREAADCTDPQQLPSRSIPEGKPPKDCDTEGRPIAPDTFVEPTTCPTDALPLNVVPDPLELPCAEYTANCISPSTGSPVTATAGQFNEYFYWQTVPDIKADQLTYIASLSAGDIATLVDRSTSEASIKSITKLFDAQVSYIRSTIDALYTSVDTEAQNWATGNLKCLYGNEEQVVNCSGNAFTDGDNGTDDDRPALPAEQQLLVDNPSVVAADTFFSSISTAAANSIALEQATADLQCLYTNTDQTACCSSVDCANDQGYTESVPNDEDPVTPSGEKRVGSYTVVAGTVYSQVSEAEANEIALALAEAELSCFYPSDEITTTCEAANCGTVWTTPYPASITAGDIFTNVGVCYMALENQATTTEGPGNYSIDNGNHPTWVVFKAYNINDVVFWEGSYWICNISMTTATSTHDTEPGVGAEWDKALWIEYDVDSPPAGSPGENGSSIYLPKGWVVFTDPTSTVVGATAQAQTIADSLLDCWWENRKREASCINNRVQFTDSNGILQTVQPSTSVSPDTYYNSLSRGIIRSYTGRLDADTQIQELADGQLLCYFCNNVVEPTCVPPGIPGGTAAPVDCSQDRTGWSVSATPGVAANTICGIDALAAQNTANGIGRITCVDLTSSDTNCCFASEEVTGVCESLYALNNGPVVLPPGTVTLCGESIDQADANLVAQQIADAIIQCWFVNRQVEVACPGRDDPSTIFANETNYDPDSTGYEDIDILPCGVAGGDIPTRTDDTTYKVIPAGKVISLTSQADADAIACSLAIAKLRCLYTNEEQWGGGGTGPSPGGAGAGYCSGSGGSFGLQEGYVAGGTVVSGVSTAEANSIASTMAQNSNVCVDPSDLGGGGGSGLPGDTGAGGDCGSDCYGYYSPA